MMRNKNVDFSRFLRELRSNNKRMQAFHSSIGAVAVVGSDHDEKDINVVRELLADGHAVIRYAGPEEGTRNVTLTLYKPGREKGLVLRCSYHAAAKVLLTSFSKAILVSPSRDMSWTLDFVMEVTTLLQTRKIPTTPILIIENDGWSQLANWLQNVVLPAGNISPEDLDLWTVGNVQELLPQIPKLAEEPRKGLSAKTLAAMRKEVRRGMKLLSNINPTSMVWYCGSARTPLESEEYREGVAFVRYISAETRTGAATGGGGGMMAAANQGARGGGVTSVGINIILPHEQKPNRFLDSLVTCKYFVTRKMLLMEHSRHLPPVMLFGGIGTLEELFELLTWMKLGLIPKRQIFLVGVEFWQGLVDALRGNLHPVIFELLVLTDDKQVVVDCVQAIM